MELPSWLKYHQFGALTFTCLKGDVRVVTRAHPYYITWRSRTVGICTSSYKGRWQYLSESSWTLPAWEFYDSRHRSITPDFGWCRSAIPYSSCCFYLIAPPPQKKDRTLFPGCYFDDIYNASFHHISHFSALFFWWCHPAFVCWMKQPPMVAKNSFPLFPNSKQYAPNK